MRKLWPVQLDVSHDPCKCHGRCQDDFLTENAVHTDRMQYTGPSVSEDAKGAAQY